MSKVREGRGCAHNPSAVRVVVVLQEISDIHASWRLLPEATDGATVVHLVGSDPGLWTFRPLSENWILVLSQGYQKLLGCIWVLTLLPAPLWLFRALSLARWACLAGLYKRLKWLKEYEGEIKLPQGKYWCLAFSRWSWTPREGQGCRRWRTFSDEGGSDLWNSSSFWVVSLGFLNRSSHESQLGQLTCSWDRLRPCPRPWLSDLV